MTIQTIVASPARVELIADIPKPVPALGRAFVPLVRGSAERHPPTRVPAESRRAEENRLIFPRYAEGYDLLTARFAVKADGHEAEGACYVTHTASEVSYGGDSSPESPPPRFHPQKGLTDSGKYAILYLYRNRNSRKVYACDPGKRLYKPPNGCLPVSVTA